jgi:hypothetical protein
MTWQIFRVSNVGYVPILFSLSQWVILLAAATALTVFPNLFRCAISASALVQSPHLMLEGDGRCGIDLK